MQYFQDLQTDRRALEIPLNTEFKRTLILEYLVKMERGDLQPAEQGVASALIGDYIRMLENVLRGLNKLDVPDESPMVSER